MIGGAPEAVLDAHRVADAIRPGFLCDPHEDLVEMLLPMLEAPHRLNAAPSDLRREDGPNLFFQNRTISYVEGYRPALESQADFAPTRPITTPPILLQSAQAPET